MLEGGPLNIDSENNVQTPAIETLNGIFHFLNGGQFGLNLESGVSAGVATAMLCLVLATLVHMQLVTSK